MRHQSFLSFLAQSFSLGMCKEIPFAALLKSRLAHRRRVELTILVHRCCC